MKILGGASKESREEYRNVSKTVETKAFDVCVVVETKDARKTTKKRK